MDIKSNTYYGRLSLSGVAMPYESTGSIMEIASASLAHLRTVNPRTLASGAKSITLQISDRPLVGSTLDSALALTEIAVSLDTSHVVTESPDPLEDVVSFQARLIRSGYSPDMATLLAGDAFGYDNTNAKLSQWIEDDKAVRFRYLNASERAADQADSEEYALLKAYCLNAYPEYVANMHVRK